MLEHSAMKQENWTAFQNICSLFVGEATDADAATWNWEKIIEVSSKHLVATSLHRNISKLTVVPQEVADYFSALHQLNSERNAVMLNGAREVCLALTQIGIRPVLLKGAACMVSNCYGDLADRFMGDIDLIVKPEELAPAYELLHKMSYFPEEVAKPWFGKSTHHNEMLMHVDTGVGIELHNSLAPPVYAKILPSADFIDQSISLNHQETDFLVLSPENRIIHSIVHAQLHHHLQVIGAASLRCWFDVKSIVETCDRQINWHAIKLHFERNKQLPVLLSQLYLCEKFVGLKTGLDVSSCSYAETNLKKWVTADFKGSLAARLRYNFVIDFAAVLKRPIRFLNLLRWRAWQKRFALLLSPNV
jgi:Uncharacterised nucleotidyltransferase